jgi:hypothetical protein
MPFMASIEATLGFGRPVRPPVQAAQPSGGIVTNGLIIQLDASNATSYPGSGTTWFDITSTNNGTLTNGPTFTSSAPKYFNFDGVDDYVNIPDVAAIRPSIGGSVTGIIWAKVSSYAGADGLISKQFGAPQRFFLKRALLLAFFF